MLQSISASSRNQAQKENAPPQSNTTAHQEQTGRETGSSLQNDELSSQNRILELRKSKFKATTVAPRNHTPLNHAFFNARDTSSPPPELSSPLDQKVSSVDVNADDCGVLQEISNSSLRRRRNNSTKNRTSLPRTSLPRTSASTTTSRRPKSSSEHALLPNRSVSAGNIFTPPSPTLHNKELVPADSPSKIPTIRHRARRSTQARRSVHDEEASKYIEHLESQLAALQTQLQSITSPSTSKAQSSKLRAMNNESRLLRQEVQDWETRFTDRLRDQTDQHEVIVGSLRAQVRSLEREAEVMQKRLHTLEADIQEKDGRIEAVDQSNLDLERRLEFMSELVATSPRKLDLCSQDPLDARKRSPTRPKSLALPLTASSLPRLSTPQRAKRQSHIGSVASLAIELDASRKTDLASPLTMRSSRQYSPTRWGSDTSTEESAVTDEAEDTSGHERPLSPTHGRLNHLRSQTECEVKSRPARQMRRFHGGAAGPRTLILPATSATGNLPASAPVSLRLGPALSSPFSAPIDPDGNRTDLSSVAPRRRSATWDDDEGVASKSRRTGSFSSLTPIMKRDRSSCTPHLAPIEISSREAGSTQSKLSQASMGYASGKSLFEEFELLDDDDDDDDDPQTVSSSGSSPQQKCQGSPSPMRHIQPPPLPNVFKHSTKPTTDPPTAIHATDSGPVPQTRSLGLITALAKAVSQSLDRRAPCVKTVCNNAWDIVTLSRPVLEFRWWLVKLLIGDLRKRRALWPPLLRSKQTELPLLERSMSLNGCLEQARGASDLLAKEPDPQKLHSPDSVTALEDVLSHLDKVKDEEAKRNRPRPPPPPLYWMRFGLTLVFAVGIALKDGPGSLLSPQRSV